MTQHTPGPWKVKGPSQNGHCRRIFAGEEYVGIVGGLGQLMSTIRVNVGLVVVVLEMLELLDECDYWFGVQDQGSWNVVELWGRIKVL